MALKEKSQTGVLAAFFVSGFTALVYEVVWARRLDLLLGHTVHAAAVTIGAFMLGLGLGARYLGTRAFMLKNPLRAFCFLEWAIAAWALLLYFLFPLINNPIRWLYAGLPDQTLFVYLFRVLIPFALLLPPTLFMGATLPCLAEFLTGRSGSFARLLSRLYGLNTLGAVLGVCLTGFVLIPKLGLSGTTFLAMACNVAVAVVAWRLSKSERPEAERKKENALVDTAVEEASSSVMSYGIFFLAAMSSFLALFMEMVWFRSLILVFGSTTYSFSAMLSIFLLGTAVGPLLYARFGRQVRAYMVFMSASLVLSGGYILLTQQGFVAMPDIFLGAMRGGRFTWTTFVLLKFFLSAVMMLPVTCLLGINFILCAQSIRDEGLFSAGAVGRVYLANTLGAVLGSFMAGFLIIPRLGLQLSFLIAGGFALVLGAGIAAIASGNHKKMRVLVPMAAVLIAIVAGASYKKWDYAEFSVGAYFKMKKDTPDGIRNREKSRYPVLDRKVIYAAAGSTASAAITRFSDGLLSFSMDGKIEADTSLHGLTNQRMVGHLAMLFHPSPQKVLNIGLGAGMSLGALGTHDPKQLDVVEIEPLAREVAKKFGTYNQNILDRESVRVFIADGRNHLFFSREKYDVISSDPYEPIVAGAGHLFTIEHYRQARKRLAEGGIMCQWVPMYEMSAADYSILLRTFIQVFPDTLLFSTGFDSILVGFKDGPADSLSTLLRERCRKPEVKASLSDIGYDEPEMILGMFIGDLSKAPESFRKGPVNTDNRPIVEFSTPKNGFKEILILPIRNVLKELSTPLPETLGNESDPKWKEKITLNAAAMHLLLNMADEETHHNYNKAIEICQAALKLAPKNALIRKEYHDLLKGQAIAYQRKHDFTRALELYNRILADNKSDYIALCQVSMIFLQTKGHTAQAKTLALKGRKLYPDSPPWPLVLGQVYHREKNWALAAVELEKALVYAPHNAKLMQFYKEALKQSGQL